MTFGDVVAYSEQLLTLVALVGAVWSAYAFVKSLQAKENATRAGEVAKWRKVNVHQLLQNSPNFLTISAITTALRASSYVTKLEIRKNELDEAEVRLLILEMLEAGTIAQLAGDQYGIRHRDPASTLDELAVHKDTIVREAFAIVNMAPRNFDTESLRQQVMRTIEVSVHNFAFILSGMVKDGLIQITSDGHWEPCIPTRKLQQLANVRAIE